MKKAIVEAPQPAWCRVQTFFIIAREVKSAFTRIRIIICRFYDFFQHVGLYSFCDDKVNTRGMEDSL
jgi:hypothetical protein